MKICKVNSLPIKEVIRSLADCLGTESYENCGEYFLKVPSLVGSGQIRGVNFDNGLGIIIYQCEFNEDIRMDFTVDDVHPVKYIYSVKGPVLHRFSNEEITHKIEQFQCAIVASERKNGHILSFEKNKNYEIVSLEIDRKRLIKDSICEVSNVAKDLQHLYSDVEADRKFYHEGFYGLEFKVLLDNISKYENKQLIRKFYLQSIGLQIFVNQLIQFDDDLMNDKEKTILRVNELNRVENLSNYIKENLEKDLSVSKLSERSGLNPNKLQTAFKYLFNNTVNEFILYCKLEAAIELLKDDSMDISEVVIRLGFRSNSYFTKIFKDKYKITPSSYKKLIN